VVKSFPWLEKEERMSRLCPYLTDEEVCMHLSDYDEQAFDQIPDWLQQELRVRHILFRSREPTEEEKLTTIQDAKEHRIYNNERNIGDFQDKYKRGKHFNFNI
jgi:hypothetical protein